MEQTYDVYMLRCQDGSLYTGIAVDWQRRFEEHRAQGDKCAKYTLSHPAKQVERVWRAPDRQIASRLEYRLKTLTKPQKELLIQDGSLLNRLLGDKLDTSPYTLIL